MIAVWGKKCTLKTCRQFLPLSFNLLSSISIISIKSVLEAQINPNTGRDHADTQLIISQLCNLVHLGPRRAPGIIGSGIADFGLCIWVSLCIVLGYPQRCLAKVLHGVRVIVSWVVGWCGGALDVIWARDMLWIYGQVVTARLCILLQGPLLE